MDNHLLLAVLVYMIGLNIPLTETMDPRYCHLTNGELRRLDDPKGYDLKQGETDSCFNTVSEGDTWGKVYCGMRYLSNTTGAYILQTCSDSMMCVFEGISVQQEDKQCIDIAGTPESDPQSLDLWIKQALFSSSDPPSPRIQDVRCCFEKDYANNFQELNRHVQKQKKKQQESDSHSQQQRR